MLRKEYIEHHPLKQIGYASEDILPPGGFGAVLAHAGAGKTAFLVQIAFYGLLRDKNVLHISLNDPVEKVCLWYEDVFKKISKTYDLKPLDSFWEAVLPHRFIMTFKMEGFSVPKLEERITDLTEQGIFFPQIIVIDSLPFDELARKTFMDLKSLAQKLSASVWFTVRTHRHEKPGPGGIPIPLLHVEDLFDTALELRPEGKQIQLQVLKGLTEALSANVLNLDPSTMLIQNP